MEKAGIVEISWTLVFQILNTGIIIGVVFAVFYLLVKIPKRIKEKAQEIDRMEKTLDEINRKLGDR